jgi:hypothetical protein
VLLGSAEDGHFFKLVKNTFFSYLNGTFLQTKIVPNLIQMTVSSTFAFEKCSHAIVWPFFQCKQVFLLKKDKSLSRSNLANNFMIMFFSLLLCSPKWGSTPTHKHKQGDQIGRIFAHWVRPLGGCLLWVAFYYRFVEVAQIYGLLFSNVLVVYLF